jgi:PAS domain S-box-containing protein
MKRAVSTSEVGAAGRAEDILARTTAAALAVSTIDGPGLFQDLARRLAEILDVDATLIAVFKEGDRTRLTTLAAWLDGKPLRNFEYELEKTPCRVVVGRVSRFVGIGVRSEFPPESPFAAKGFDSYAAHSLMSSGGEQLGMVVALDRAAMTDQALTEALLQIFAARAAAEIERSRAEQSYREIFDAAEDAIFIHDWDTGAIVDVSAKAASLYGHSRETLRRLRVGDISADLPPYTESEAMAHIERAKQSDGLLRFDWRARLSDGTLRWHEVTLKRAQVGGHRRVLAFVRDVTERKAAADELLMREQQYRAIFDGSADAMVLWNDEIRFVDVNRAFVQMYGFSREEVVGTALDNRLPADEVALRTGKIRAALAGKEGVLETETLRKDGTSFFVELRYLPITHLGRPHALVIARDITERRAAEAALRASEAQYRAMFEAATDALQLLDANDRVVDVNPAYERMYGKRREEVVGKDLIELVPPQFQEERKRLVRRALDGHPVELQTIGFRADGTPFDLEVRVIPFRHRGQPHVLGIARDITDRKHAESALRASEEQYRAIFNASADALVLRDAEFRIVDVNATYERMSGWKREEVLGLDRVVANPPAAAALIRSRHEHVLAGEIISLEVPFVRRDGTPYEIELRGVPIQQRGQPHVLYIGRDVTERKRAERALRSSEEQYRAIFNASEDALVLWDSSLRRVDVNPAYERVFGWSPEEVIGRSFEATTTSSDYAEPRAEMVRRTLAGEACHAELVSHHKHRGPFHADIRTVPIRYRGEPHALVIVRDVTERKRTEVALRYSEEQHRTIFNASVDGMLVKDAGNVVVDVNDAYLRMHGFSRDELVGRCLLDFLPPELRSVCRELLPAVLAGTPCHFESRTWRRDRSILDVEIHGVPVVYGGESRALVIMRDITERKLAEARLRASEEQYRSIFNVSADAMMLWDSQLKRVDVNPAHEKMFGYTRDEVVGRGFENLDYPPELVQPRLERVRRALAGEASQAEVEAQRKGGERIVTELRTIPFVHRGEAHVLQVARDITEQKRAEDALRVSEARYRLLFDTESDALVLVDVETLRLVDVNQAATKLYARSRDELLTLTASDLSAEPEETRRSIQQGAGALDIPVRRHRDRNGRTFPVEIKANRLVLDGRMTVVAAIRDISERQRLEAQLRQAQKMEAIGQLTGGVAHDFNNILASVMGYVVLAEERSSDAGDAKTVDYLGQALASCRRARDLIQQMLTFSRGGRGEPRALSLRALVHDATPMLRSALPSTLAIEVSSDDTVPAVWIDEVQAHQVLLNLAINARDAMPGGGTLRIEVARSQVGGATCASCRHPIQGQFVELRVADSGRGIDAALMERIFDPFFTTKAPGKGSGMGLSMVHGIVHEHRGHILVDSEPGQGCVFRVLLPVHEASPVRVQVASAKRVDRVPLAGRVLLVDDEPSVLAVMRETLVSWGLDVEACASADAAERAFATDPARFDLLVTDYAMPLVTGVELAERLKARRPDLPWLLCTGYADLDTVTRTEMLGAAAVLRKPIEREDLRAAVKAAMTRGEATSTTPSAMGTPPSKPGGPI